LKFENVVSFKFLLYRNKEKNNIFEDNPKFPLLTKSYDTLEDKKVMIFRLNFPHDLNFMEILARSFSYTRT